MEYFVNLNVSSYARLLPYVLPTKTSSKALRQALGKLGRRRASKALQRFVLCGAQPHYLCGMQGSKTKMHLCRLRFYKVLHYACL